MQIIMFGDKVILEDAVEKYDYLDSVFSVPSTVFWFLLFVCFGNGYYPLLKLENITKTRK